MCVGRGGLCPRNDSFMFPLMLLANIQALSLTSFCYTNVMENAGIACQRPFAEYFKGQSSRLYVYCTVLKPKLTLFSTSTRN